MSASPSAERGNVEPSAEAKRLIGAYGEQQLRAGFRDDAFVSSAVIDARASLYAYVARLESAASPPSAPRAAGAWGILKADGELCATYLRRELVGRDLEDLNEHGMYRPYTLVPLYAGAAPTPANHEDLIRRLGFDRDTLRSGVNADGGHSGNGALREWFRAGYLVDTVAPDLDEAIAALRTGSAPPSGAGVSEEEETPDEIRFRAYYAGYYDALPQPSSTKESDLALAMAEARKYVERHNAAPAPRDEI